LFVYEDKAHAEKMGYDFHLVDASALVQKVQIIQSMQKANEGLSGINGEYRLIIEPKLNQQIYDLKSELTTKDQRIKELEEALGKIVKLAKEEETLEYRLSGIQETARQAIKGDKMSEVKKYYEYQIYENYTMKNSSDDVFVLKSDYDTLKSELSAKDAKCAELERYLHNKGLDYENRCEQLNYYLDQRNDARKTIYELENCLIRISKALDNNEIISNGGPTHWQVHILLEKLAKKTYGSEIEDAKSFISQLEQKLAAANENRLKALELLGSYQVNKDVDIFNAAIKQLTKSTELQSSGKAGV
jgi:hypothetical protein